MRLIATLAHISVSWIFSAQTVCLWQLVMQSLFQTGAQTRWSSSVQFLYLDLEQASARLKTQEMTITVVGQAKANMIRNRAILTN